MQLKGKRVAILAEKIYEDMELWYPYYRLKEEGATVVVVGSGSADHFESKHGLSVKVDVNADQVSASDFDAVVVPGGYAPDHMRRYPAMLKLVHDTNQQGKVVAAICHAGWVLASAKVTRGRTLTSVAAIKDDLVNTGANWVDQEVVRDGNLITSRTPADLPAYMRAIIEAMSAEIVPAK